VSTNTNTHERRPQAPGAPEGERGEGRRKGEGVPVSPGRGGGEREKGRTSTGRQQHVRSRAGQSRRAGEERKRGSRVAWVSSEGHVEGAGSAEDHAEGFPAAPAS